MKLEGPGAMGDALGGSDFDDAAPDDTAEGTEPQPRHPSWPSPEAWAGASPPARA